MRKTFLPQVAIADVLAAIASSAGEYVGPTIDLTAVPVTQSIAFAATIHNDAVVSVNASFSIDFSNNGVNWERDSLVIPVSDAARGRATRTDFVNYTCNFARVRVTAAAGTGSYLTVDAKL